MFQLSVGCMFKNEADNLDEWLRHYIHHGVEHFYMINDQSTDHFIDVLRPFIDKNIVTLFDSSFPYYKGRQRDLYNTFILPRINKTKWLLMVDIDEYVWSPIYLNLVDLLTKCEHLGQIQFYDVLFGSNNHIKQPKTIFNSFTMREAIPRQFLKYVVNTKFEFSSLNVHHATFKDLGYENGHFFQIFNQDVLINNHYNCMSKNWWVNTKMTRGDSDHYRVRTLEEFDQLDKNEVEDLRLVEQN